MKRGVMAVCLAAALVAGGCSSAADKSPAAEKSAGVKPTPTVAAVPTGTVDPLPDMGQKFEGILKDVDLAECTLDEGKAVARGTVKNAATKPRDLMVAIVWLVGDQGQATSIRAFTAKKVAPGATKEFTLNTTLATTADKCVIQAKSSKAGTL